MSEGIPRTPGIERGSELKADKAVQAFQRLKPFSDIKNRGGDWSIRYNKLYNRYVRFKQNPGNDRQEVHLVRDINEFMDEYRAMEADATVIEEVDPETEGKFNKLIKQRERDNEEIVDSEPVQENLDEDDDRVEIPPPLALMNPANEGGSGTPAESREQLRATVRKLAGVKNTKKQEFLDAKKELLDAEEKYNDAHSAVGRFVDRFLPSDDKKNIERLERELDKKAFFWQEAKREALKEYIQTKENDLNTQIDESTTARFMTQRVWKVEDDRIQAQKERQEREASEAGYLKKSLGWVAEQSAKLDKKLGKDRARLVRIFGSATVGTAVVAAFGGVAGLSALGAAFLWKFTRATVGVVGGGVLGSVAGKASETSRKKKQEAMEEESRVVAQEGDFEKRRGQYRKFSDAAIERARKNTEVGVALALGGSIGLYSLLHAPVVGAVTTVQGTGLGGGNEAIYDNANYTASLEDKLSEMQNDSLQQSIAHPQITESAPSVDTESPAPVSASIDAHPTMGGMHERWQNFKVEATAGRGYEQMLYDMGEKLKTDYPNGVLPKGSDAARLLDAAQEGKKALQNEVHRIAGEHKFWNNGQNVVVRPESVIRLNQSGAVEIDLDGAGSNYHFQTLAPESEPTTPDAVHTVAPEQAAPQLSAQLDEGQVNPHIAGVYEDNNGDINIYGADHAAHIARANEFLAANNATTVYVPSVDGTRRVPLVWDTARGAAIEKRRGLLDWLFGIRQDEPVSPQQFVKKVA